MGSRERQVEQTKEEEEFDGSDSGQGAGARGGRYSAAESAVTRPARRRGTQGGEASQELAGVGRGVEAAVR